MKNISRYIEVFFTAFLIIPAILLLSEVVPSCNIYSIIAIVLAFCFSWFIRDRQNWYLKYSIIAAGLLAIIWSAYAILNSSFLYKEVITINVNGLLALLFIFSLNIFSAQNLGYVQVLTVLLFMSFPTFKKDPYSGISIALILTYCFGWIIILKVKFYEAFGPLEEKNVKQYYSVSIPVVIFIIIAVLSWGLSSTFPLAEIRSGGLLSEDLPGGGSGLEKGYYDLQDKMLKEVTDALSEFHSVKNSKDSLSLLNLMIEESPNILELAKAESGLISYLKQEGPGLEENADGLIDLIKDYVDKKVMLNLEKSKVDLAQSLKQNKFNFVKRIKISEQINKMLTGSSYKDLSGSWGGLEKEISDSPLSPTGKRDVRQLARQLKKWKTYELYRKKTNSPRDNFTPGDLKEISSLKSDLSAYLEAGKLKNELENSAMPEDRKEEMLGALDDIQELRGVNSFVKSSEALISGSEQQGDDVVEDAEGLIGDRAKNLIAEKHAEIEKLLNESVLPDEKKDEFLTNFKQMENSQSEETTATQEMKLASDLNGFQEKGFISGKTKSVINGKLNEFVKLIPISSKATLGMQGTTAQAPQSFQGALGLPGLVTQASQSPGQASGVQGAPAQTPQNSKGASGAKAEAVQASQSSEQAPAQALQSPKATLGMQGTTSQAPQNVKTSSGIEEMASLTPQSSEQTSGAKETAAQALQKSKAAKKGQKSSSKKTPGLEETAAQAPPKLISIAVFPEYLKFPLGESRDLVAKGNYNDHTQQDITPFVKWLSSASGIVTVASGKAESHSTGDAQVSAMLEGITSRSAFITVEEPSLISIILSPKSARVLFGTKFNLKAEGYFSNASRKDLTALVSWQINNPGIIAMDKGNIRTKLLGETLVSAEYLGIKSLPATITIIFNLRWLLGVISKILCFAILGGLILLIVFYVTIRRKAKRFLSFYGSPREFIIALYENAKEVPLVFGLKQEGFLPPLAYAELVEKRHSVENKLFLRFTAKFEEAKYSGHNFPVDDSRLVLDYYNDFIGVLFSKHAKPSFFSKYWLALIYRTPLFIRPLQ